MSRARASFTEASIRRACKGALAAGLPLRGIEISPDGVIRVLIGEPDPAQHGAPTQAESNEWDEVLLKR